MDPLPVAVAIAATALGTVLVLWYRKRQIEKTRILLRRSVSDLGGVEAALDPFVRTGDYIPERLRRPLDAKASEVAAAASPSTAKIVRRARDSTMRSEFEDLQRRSGDVHKILQEHNERFVRGLLARYSTLLVEQLKADEAQQRAIVRDDERNLIIAGAGSGKTRTIVGRICFLLERGVPANAILAVTFTNKATEEMRDRLRQVGASLADRASDGVTVSTLHALGKRVVQASRTAPISVADDRWMDSLVAAALRDARESRDPELARLYINAVLHFHRNEDERAPAVGGDKTYRTLRGDHVRSVGERIIADFFLIHHVDYKYETKAAWADVGAGRNAYHPDFTLPGSGATIEYWGVNRDGEVPAGWATSSGAYRQGMEWKRDQFRRAHRTLLEFYDYERTEGVLEDRLLERCTNAGVVLSPMTLAELEKAGADLKYVGSTIERLLVSFLTNARSLRRSPDEIRQRLERTTPRVYHFSLLGIAVLERYTKALALEDRIDFSDMLHQAADLLDAGTNPLPKFQHILVDEFQDTSAAMARFLKGLLAATGARLFAVGDDWQAIYGFAGGDLDYIVNFESHFGPASTTMLNVNYRSPAVIVEAGAALIAHNPKQVPKQILVASRERGEAYVHEVPDDDAAIVSATIRLIQQERQHSKPEDILVLSRTNHLLDPILEACRRNRIPLADSERNLLGIRVLSAHKAKGLEGSIVIVVNASDHLLGFPSKVENPDVLEPVRMSTGNDAAEERRLFYVAITRAMKRLHLLSRKGLPSPYLAEIEGEASAAPSVNPAGVRVGDRFNGLFYVERVHDRTERQAAVQIRQSGLLSTSTGWFPFTSWAPIDLEVGATYWLGGVMKDRPYRDQQPLRIDSRTRVEKRSAAAAPVGTEGPRELRPRPPPSLQPSLFRR